MGLSQVTEEELSERARPKLERLLEMAKGKTSILAQTHDFPDPDTIASAWALTWLLEELTGLKGQLGYGGIIGRAENRAMIKLLGIRIRKTTPSEFKKYDLLALLDTQPECGNHSIPTGIRPDIVVDHHFMRERDKNAPAPDFSDIGGGFGSTSTKLTELVRASGLTPPSEIATALFYGVKSDTANLARLSNPADVAAYLWLFPFVDTKLIADIENPQVPLDYFRVFNKAIERGKIYGNAIVADLGTVYTPDLCAELADRLLQVEGIRHAIATGWFEDALFFSIRTRSRKQNAGKILNTIISTKNYGSAGGHGPMAGARVPLEGRSQRSRTDLRRRLVQQILIAFGQDPRHYKRMVTRSKSETGRSTKAPPRVTKNDRTPSKNGERKSKETSKKRSSVAPATNA